MSRTGGKRGEITTARRLAQISAFALIGASLASCAQPPQPRHAGRNGKEYFSQAQYGRASPRVIADGPIPHGGGQYLVGNPYTIAGRTYYPSENESYTAVGMASWYGDAFQGRRTANGEVYDMRSITAAHPTMPLPSYARVTNLANGHSIIVRVNDRGPYHGGRVMDVSSRVADVLDFKGAGTAHVKVEYVGKASLDGSDDEKLLATLRTDGGPATLEGFTPVMVASNVFAPVEKLASVATEAPAPVKPTPIPEPQPAAPVAALAAPTRAMPAKAPLPPVRPFDLGTIPDAANPIRSAEVAILPPRRPPLQALAADNALYFAPPLTAPSKLVRGKGPFDKLNGRMLTPANEE